MKNTNEKLVSIDIWANASKQDEMSPDLKGHFEFEGQPLEIALWSRWTKAGDRMYHSFRITDPFKKGETPKVYVKGGKLYEIDSADSAGPDFQGPAAFELLGQSCWAAMWIEAESEGSDLAFRLELLRKPFSTKLSKGAAETQQDLRDRTLERRREREAREAQATNIEPNPEEELPEIPF
jgi:hypothetical protein